MAKLQTINTGFTLVELLIVLLIIGEIVTFTIPKILYAQADQKNNAIVNEVASMVAAVYGQSVALNGGNTNIGIAALTQYMNYSNVDAASTIDKPYGSSGSQPCGGSNQCLRLHNGAILMFWPADYFGGTGTTNGIPFWVDPDGQLTDTTATGTEKAVRFTLYYNGRVVDMANVSAGTTWNGGSNNSSSSPSPPWFAW